MCELYAKEYFFFKEKDESNLDGTVFKSSKKTKADDYTPAVFKSPFLKCKTKIILLEYRVQIFYLKAEDNPYPN